MNHPRRRLLLVPLALLGAALLVRARLPRPQTEGNKWLWEQGESATSLSVWVRKEHRKVFNVGFSSPQCIKITDRQGLRALLRAFHRTPSFVPSPISKVRIEAPVSLLFSDGHHTQSLQLYDWPLTGRKGHYCLAHQSDREVVQEDTVPDAASVQRFTQALQEAATRAQHSQSGYSLQTARDFASAFEGSIR